MREWCKEEAPLSVQSQEVSLIPIVKVQPISVKSDTYRKKVECVGVAKIRNLKGRTTFQTI